nr:pentatricopeptide repeat-containing protein At2g32630 [Ipomoea trifida]
MGIGPNPTHRSRAPFPSLLQLLRSSPPPTTAIVESMSAQAFFKTVKRVFPKKSDAEIASSISKTLTKSTWNGLDINPSLISSINPQVARLVLSNPHVPHLSCLNFFKFLQNNKSLTVSKPDLQAHIILVLRLFRARKFNQGKDILNAVAADDSLRRPVSEIADLVRENNGNPKMVVKLMDMLLRVYVDNMRFKEAEEVFDYLKNNEFEIDDRSCMVYLLAVKRSNQFHSMFEFFQKMVKANVKITVYSMTMVIDGLCKRGEVDKARKLMDDMLCRGVKPNEYTYNTLLDRYVKNSDLGAVKEILNEMEKEGMELNATSYTVLIEGYSNLGNFEEAEKLFEKMQQKNIEPDVHLYTCMISSYNAALKLFNEMSAKGLAPTVVSYTALISGLSKEGRSEEAFRLYDEMIEAGLTPDDTVYSSLVGSLHSSGQISSGQISSLRTT